MSLTCAKVRALVCVCVQCRGPCSPGKVLLQQSVVLHNVSAAAGDDASHHHAGDETPSLRAGLRGAAAGIDNAGARAD